MTPVFCVVLLSIFLKVLGKDLCECQSEAVVCKGATEQSELKASLESLHHCEGRKLKIKKFNLTDLPQGLLQTQSSNFTRLNIQDGVLYFLFDPFKTESPFEDGRLIDEINIEKTRYLYNWNWALFNPMTNLRELYIRNCDFLYIDASFSAFESSSLKKLTIDASKVRWIHRRAFSGMKNVINFIFRQNDITSFRRDFLPKPANRLAYIDLQRNKIQSVDDDSFSSMPSLNAVNLRNNRLMTLNEKMILNLDRINYLHIYINGNPLKCDCRLAWLWKYERIFELRKLCTRTEPLDGTEVNYKEWYTHCYDDSIK